MKIIKKILIVLVVLIAIAAIAGMFMSSKFSMERSIVINANEQVIFDQVNILKNWEKWSPWQKMDLTSKMTYFGPESGVGAGYTWVSENKSTGSGTLTISESVPNQKVTTDLDFKDSKTWSCTGNMRIDCCNPDTNFRKYHGSRCGLEYDRYWPF